MRCQKGPSENAHNHPLHSATKISQCVRERISNAVSANPSLTTSDIAQGKGLGFLPSAADDASCHTGKISQEVRRAKSLNGYSEKDWSQFEFEKVADATDLSDNKISGDSQDKLVKYNNIGRPYLVSAGIEERIKYVFTMSPLMAKIGSEAEFIQCDITYDDLKEYPYLFNAVAFNFVTMEWMVIARVRLNKQTSEAYRIAFSKMFGKCSSVCSDFQPGSSLLGVLIDWSVAEMNGLQRAVGKSVADELLKGCRVHWNRSCQRVADRVAKSKNKKDVFLKICYIIPKLKRAVEVVACFESLCGVRPLKKLIKNVPVAIPETICDQIDEECDWTTAKNWAQWWAKSNHLKMLSMVFSSMTTSVWNACPNTTNAVERKNKDCKTDNPQSLKLAMLKVYKLDKIACLKHIAAEACISLSYRSRIEDARRDESERKQKQRSIKDIPVDRRAQFGPPDKSSNFLSPSRRIIKENANHEEENTQTVISALPPTKRKGNHEQNKRQKRRAIGLNEAVVDVIPDNNPSAIGKKVKMMFDVEGRYEWYEGIVAGYNIVTGKYSIFFPYNNETIQTNLDDEDLKFID